MRKYFYVLYALLVVGILCPDTVAQNSSRTPVPDWVFEKPEPSNETFFYFVVLEGGATEKEAINNAFTGAFRRAAYKSAVPVNFKELKEAISNGTNAELLSQCFNIPLNIVCQTSSPIGRSGSWYHHLLCQIPEKGYANNAQYDVFNDCDKHEIYDKIQKKWAAKSKENDLETLEEVGENESVTKILHEGHILITIGDKVYTIQGQEVK